MKSGVLVLALLAAAVFGPPAQADTATYNFNDGTLDGLVVQQQTAGYSYTVTGGKLNLSAVNGAGAGGIDLETPFAVTGNFTETVVATWALPTNDGDLQLGGGNGLPGGLANYFDVFFTFNLGPAAIQSNIYGADTLLTTNYILDASMSATLKLTRTGDTVAAYYDDGSGFVEVASYTDPSLLGSFTPRIGLDQYEGGIQAQSSSFDELTITSPSITSPVPLPTAAGSGLCVFLGLAGIKLISSLGRRSGCQA